MRNGNSSFLVAASLLAACASGSATSGAVPNVAASEGHVDAGNGVRLFYRTRGAGPDTAIVIHGGPGFTMDYFLDDLTPLARNRVLIFYDQRGIGGSTLVSDSATLVGERYAEDLEALRRHFRLSKLTLIGHSWGPGVVALYAQRHPENIGRLLLVSALPLRGRALMTAFGAMAAGRDSVMTRKLGEANAARRANPGDPAACRAYYVLWFDAFFANPADMRKSRGDFCAGSVESRRNKMAAVDKYTFPSLGDWDWRDAVRRIDAPTLAIHGTEDPLPLDGAREWVSLIPGARIIILEGVGHFPYVEAPDRFFPAADAFLSGRWPEGAAAR